MPENNVSAALTAEDREAVRAAIRTIREKLPFLITLSAEDRQALPKLGDKSRAFVAQALELVSQNQDFMPRSFSLEEMRKDVELFDGLASIRMELMALADEVDDTFLEVGSEAYTAALLVYQYAKTQGVALGGLSGSVDALARRFARKVKSNTPEAPEATK